MLNSDIQFNGFGKSEYFSREKEALTLYSTIEIGPYKKVSALVCLNGKRCAITYTSPIANNGKGEINESDNFDEITDLVSSGNKIKQEEVEKLANKMDVLYLHLSKFEAGTLVDNYSGTR